MTNTLRFCLCTSFFPPFNSDEDGLYAQSLANGLARLGHDVTVLHNPDAYEILHRKKVTEPYALHPGVTIRPISPRLKSISLLAVQQSGRACFQKAALQEAFEQPFDVIHYYNISLLGGPGIFSMGKSTLKIAGLNDHWLVCPMHLLWKYTGEVCDKPQCVRCSLRSGRPPQFWRYTGLLDTMSRHVDAFLAPSLFTMQKHLERGFDGHMIHLPGLYDVPEDTLALPAELLSGRPYFFCTGRLEYYKGFQEVIPLFKDFPQYSLVICGEGSYRRELQSLAHGMANVHISAKVCGAHLQAMYKNAVATIVPTLSYQTFCHVTAGSFSAGTPVIAHKLGAAGEVIGNHGGGILYTRPEELRQAIAGMIQDTEARRELQRQALEAFARNHSESVYLRRYMDIVQELLAQKASHGRIAVSGDDATNLAGR